MQGKNLHVIGALSALEGWETALSRELKIQSPKCLYKQTLHISTNLLSTPKPCLDSILMNTFLSMSHKFIFV